MLNFIDFSSYKIRTAPFRVKVWNLETVFIFDILSVPVFYLGCYKGRQSLVGRWTT